MSKTDAQGNIGRIALAVITALAFFTRFYKLNHPNEVVFDEVHFGKFASYVFIPLKVANGSICKGCTFSMSILLWRKSCSRSQDGWLAMMDISYSIISAILISIIRFPTLDWDVFLRYLDRWRFLWYSVLCETVDTDLLPALSPVRWFFSVYRLPDQRLT